MATTTWLLIVALIVIAGGLPLWSYHARLGWYSAPNIIGYVVLVVLLVLIVTRL